MRRIGSHLSALLLMNLALFLYSPNSLHAQDVELRASLSENTVFVGEQFTLTIEVHGERMRNIELPELPEISGSRLVSQTPARGQRISIINGRTNTVTSYTYTLIAQSEGTYHIAPVTVRIDDEAHRTEPLRVEIHQHRAATTGTERRPDIFAEITLDNEEPIVGQQLIANLNIYFREGVEITSYQPGGGWRTDGFWKEQLENIEQPVTETLLLGGVRYRRATLLRFALFASRPGDLTLSPFELHLGVRTQPRRNDPFGSVFGGLGSNQRRVTLETEAITLPVRRIETPDRGQSIGAVGDFEIRRSASVRRSYVGEPIELITTISGLGNLPLLNRPSYPLPDSFETYSPQEETDLSRRGTTIQGSRTFRDRFVPRVAGSYTLPEQIISVYDPSRSAYRYHTLPAITFEVIRDPAATIADSGSDLLFTPLQGLAIWHRADNNRPLLHSWWVWIGLLLPLILLATGRYYKRKTERLENDYNYARSHYAWDRVEALLLKAEQEAVGDSPKKTYHMLHKAISGYIMDRTSLPEAGISDETLIEEITKHTGQSDLPKRLRKILDRCASISYAPLNSRENIETDIHSARTLLRELREVL